ncbi:hypothetical protein C4J81_13880 [Deltaproteobacteria bacterium Smac51]|nr:hypothetical protein C4J81_13880 [Deltaproteobacteria bacterium Smac51]
MMSSSDRLHRPETVSLPGGRLDIAVTRSDWPLGDLCGFAGRYNPARAYLFVSKVLGKHYPVKPSVMGSVHDLLAGKISALDIQSPAVVIAMAETATGLGHGVFEACLRQRHYPDWLFLHTTRYTLERPFAFQISEDHCHAREHLIYEPSSGRGRDIFNSARTLILVDDEMSTGNTLLNLAKAFAARTPAVERLILVSLTCWLDEERRAALAAGFGRPTEFVSVLDGTFSFTPKAGGSNEIPSFRSVGDWAPKDDLLPGNFGRLGLCSSEANHAKRSERLRQMRLKLDLDPRRPVLVLGTGEFLHHPYLLARYLEEEGFETCFQSTTRTPARVGQDLAAALRFTDNYYDGLDNFLYNVSADSDSQKIICYETVSLPPDHDLPGLINAQTVFFEEAF